MLDFSISGGALFRGHGVVDFGTVDPDLANVLPKISTDILADFTITFDDNGIVVGKPSVAIADVTLDLGSFISKFAGRS